MPIVKHEDGTLRYKSAEYWIPKPWQGLTDSDMHTIRDDAFVKNVDDIEWALQMARRIESKLKERNGG
jgi:hypothetical protein